ncbi:hypothetical protein JOL62DRAFT_223752 [Phyllosticta paracitricarpa]|uniref:Secreted peptide n=1 Tax=Phyllosticta paracitricarpa TaxID=2016321 RepID=A0ABR1NH53_9PEZI
MAGASFFFFFFFFLVTSLAFLTSYAAIFLVSVITHAAFLLLMRVVWCRCFQLSLCIWHFDERRWFMGLVGVDEGLALAAISLFLMKYIDWGFFFFFFCRLSSLPPCHPPILSCFNTSRWARKKGAFEDGALGWLVLSMLAKLLPVL